MAVEKIAQHEWNEHLSGCIPGPFTMSKSQAKHTASSGTTQTGRIGLTRARGIHQDRPPHRGESDASVKEKGERGERAYTASTNERIVGDRADLQEESASTSESRLTKYGKSLGFADSCEVRHGWGLSTLSRRSLSDSNPINAQRGQARWSTRS